MNRGGEEVELQAVESEDIYSSDNENGKVGVDEKIKILRRQN